MERLRLSCLAVLLVIAFGVTVSPGKSWAAYGDFLSSINTGGLTQPTKVAVDSANGDVYVTDAGTKSVKKYDKSGNYQSGFSLSVSGTPVGIAVNANNIFVGDSDNKCVWIFDKTGAAADLSATGTSHKLGGASGASINMPNSVAVAPSGHIFVADGDNDDVLIYNSDGSYYSSFGGPGTGNGVFYYPSGITFGSSSGSPSVTQYFYVGDQGNYRVQEFSYVYNNTTNAITTPPAYYGIVGLGKGDGFGKFLRVSDLAYDKIYNRLLVDDSLQQVVQEFDSNGATLNAAFNYSGGSVQGYLNTPTGVALGYGGNSEQDLYVASNQGSSIVTFVASQGQPPSITGLTPTLDTVPTSTPYTINYTVTDPDTINLTVKIYYYNVSSPGTLVPIATQSVTLPSLGANYNGSFAWNWTASIGGYTVTPPEPVGDWKIYATVDDGLGGLASATSGKFSIVNNYGGYANYTNYLYTLYGAATGDYDGDGLTNYEELNGTWNGSGTYTDSRSGLNHTYNYNNASTDMTKADSDGDGLTDGQEEGRVAAATSYFVHTNPNNPDTDGGGIKDGPEVLRGTDPLNASDDPTPSATLVGMYYDSRTNMAISGIAGVSTYCGSGTNPPTPYTLQDYATDQYFVTTYEVNNPTDKSVTATLYIYDMNGNQTYSGGLSFSPHESKEINPATYPNSLATGSIEISSTGGVLNGMEYITVNSAGSTPQLQEQTAVEMPAASTAASTLYNAQWQHQYNIDSVNGTPSGARDVKTYTMVHNPNSTSITLEIKIFDMSNNLLADVTGITLNAHGTLHFTPQDYGVDPIAHPKGTMEIDTTGGPALGFMSKDFVNTCSHFYESYFSYQLFTANDATPIIYSANFNNYYMNGQTTVTPSTDPSFSTNYTKGWSTWYQIRNSSPTTSIDLNDTWYNITGSLTHGPAVDKTLAANGYAGLAAFQSPQYDKDQKGYVVNTAALPTMLGAAISYNQKLFAFAFKSPISRSNVFYLENWQSPTSPPTSGYVTYLAIINPNSVSSTVTITYYNADGSLNNSAKNPVIITLNPTSFKGVNPYGNSIYGSGSAVITATSPVMCYAYTYDYTLITSNYTSGNSASAWDPTMHPRAPSVPNAVAGAPGHITVSWTMSPDDPLNTLGQPKGSMDVVGYYIYRSTAYGGPYTVVGKVSAGTATFDDSTAITGTSYHYKVAATTDNTHFSETTETIAVQAP